MLKQNPTKVDIQRITFEMRPLQHRPELPEMWRNVENIPDKEEKPPQLRAQITGSRCGQYGATRPATRFFWVIWY